MILFKSKILLRVCAFTVGLVILSCSTAKKKAEEKEVNHRQQLEVSDSVKQKLMEQETYLENLKTNLSETIKVAKTKSPQEQEFIATDLYLKASDLLLKGEYLVGSIFLEKVIELSGEQEYLMRKYSVALIQLGKIDQAQVTLEKLYNRYEKGSIDDQIGMLLAGIYSTTGKVQRAQAVYKEILRQDPKHEDACIFYSKNLHVLKKSQQAIRELKKCEKFSNEKNGMFSYYIGKIYIDLKKYKKSIVFFRKAAKIDGSLSQAILAIGLIYEELGKNEKAMKTYEQHLEKNPDDVLILERVVENYFILEKYKEVIPYAERLIDLEQDNLNLKVKLGILYTDIKEYHKAIKVFQSILAAVPNSDKIHYYLGAIYQEINEWDLAIKALNKVGSDSVLYPDSSLQIAQLLSTLAQVKKLEKKSIHSQYEDEFHRFVKNKIQEEKLLVVEFSVIRSNHLEESGDTDEAIDSLVNVSDNKDFTNNHRYYLASLYEKLRQFNKAFKIIEKIIETDPKNAHAYNFLGYSLLEQDKDFEQAYKYIQKAVELNPKDGYIRDSLGWYYYKMGDMQKALSELQLALANLPQDVAINKHLAMVYLKINDYKNAKLYLENALKNVKAEHERDELRKVYHSIDKKREPASSQK
ncbi:tetratricopeptide repeat protein [Bacteriovoracaceae bacterium]|nr:tetratricopeptide repeat protein [Bacteriovoracaceae bacterium]